MSRIHSTGAELQAAGAGYEFSARLGSAIIDTGVFRSGSASVVILSLSSGTEKGFSYTFSSSAGDGPYFFRTYLRINTLPSAENRIIRLGSSIVYITLDNSGVLRLYDEDGQVGSASSALSLSTWYRVEIKMDRTASAGSHVVEAKLDGTVFATDSTRSLSVGITEFAIGGNQALETQTTGRWNFDDIAINDNTGSFQNDYPGDGKIIHLHPNASGNSNQWLHDDGTAGDTNNYTEVDEITPDDSTSYVKSTILNDEDFYNVEASGLSAESTINLVALGVRYAADAGGSLGFKLEAKKSSGGTISQSTEIIPNSTTFRTNSPSDPRNYNLVMYQDPDNLNWTKDTLDTMQIGQKITTDSTNTAYISAVWALVEYTENDLTEGSGGRAFGEQSPSSGEVAVSWRTYTDGAGAIPTVIGDTDWGKLELNTGEEGRSRVYDFGSSAGRVITLTQNRYGTGQGTATLQYRGHDSTAFAQDSDEVSGPTWQNYSAAVIQTWRYIQVREIKNS